MKKLLLLVLLISAAIGCNKDESHNSDHPKLATIKFTALQFNKAFSGGLELYPCYLNTTDYIGNYYHNTLSVINPSCVINKGSISNWGYQLWLPLGTYNMIYWGVSNASVYSASRVSAPALRLNTDLSNLYWSMVLTSDRTTYMPVWDQVMAAQDIEMGSSDLSVNLDRKVAGLNVVIKNSDGSAFAPAITSFEVLVGKIAEKINLATGLPENQTKTVRFDLTINPDRTTASNAMVMLYPSAPAPNITINISLSNGQTKTYSTTLRNAFEANTVQTVTILTGDILATDPSGSTFTIDDWDEISQTIDVPIL